MTTMKNQLGWTLAGAAVLALGLLWMTWYFLGSFKGPSMDLGGDGDPHQGDSLSQSTQVYKPVADGFDFPVGPPDAKKYYNAQGFQQNSHLGEDWNGIRGGDTDLGDPVFAIANGIVTSAADEGEGWGNVVLLQHNVGDSLVPRFIESLYAHLDSMWVRVGDTLQRGQQLGTMGDAHGAYAAHLHFEMRHRVGMGIGGGYSDDTTGFLVPTVFIKAHRPQKEGSH